MNQKIINAVKYGTLYFPANKHYMGEGTVMCDKCGAKDISVCVGWRNDTDICLKCAQEIANMLSGRRTYTPRRILIHNIFMDSSDDILDDTDSDTE